MTNLKNLLKNAKPFMCGEPASESDIRFCESRLGIAFSKDFSDYLREFGWIAFLGHELTGISTDVRLNVVDVTMRTRSLVDNMPSDLYISEELNDDVYYCQKHNGAIYKMNIDGSLIFEFDSLEQFIIASQ